MKKILGLTLAVVLVIGLVAGGTWALFSDTEEIADNVFAAGTIDFEMSPGVNEAAKITLENMKPCDWVEYTIILHNLGTNDGPVYLHFDVGEGYNAITSEAGNPDVNNIEDWITVDLILKDAIGNYVIIDPDDHIKLGWLDCKWIPLGWFGGGHSYEIELVLSFHLQAETGNAYQGDAVAFDVEAYMTDHNAPGPNPIALFLENKTDGDWRPIAGDGMWGLITFNPQGSTFDYSATLWAYGLQPDTEYALVYYADPWPNVNGKVIGLHTTDSNGDIIGATGNPDLGIDIPVAADANYPTGGKIWLILSADLLDTTPTVGGSAEMNAWNQAQYLYETQLIKYDDTDV